MNIRRFSFAFVLAALLLAFSATSFAGIFVSVSIGPPPIPVYTQPPCPGYGYIWTPGYWGYGDEGYYWIPGTWVQPPEAGLYWTPGYWGWNNDAYEWNDGYWGPQVGFYGGINYGFGYTGSGYYGGEWRGRDFYYNRNVNNVNITNIRNVYNRTVVVNNNNHVSYNGGSGGTYARPTPQQLQYRNARHVEATNYQRQQREEAARNRELYARNNQGRPPIAATARPGDFKNAVPAKSAGGRVDRRALEATPRTAAPRVNAGTRNETRPATRETSPAAARNVPRPGNSDRRPESGNASSRNVPRPPSATSTERARTNDRVTAPPARESGKPSPATESRRSPAPRPAPTRPSVSASSHESSASPRPRNQDMPQSDRGPRPSAAPRESARPSAAPRESRPAPRAESAPQRSAAPAHSQAAEHSQAPQHREDSRHDNNDKPKK